MVPPAGTTLPTPPQHVAMTVEVPFTVPTTLNLPPDANTVSVTVAGEVSASTTLNDDRAPEIARDGVVETEVITLD